jgi:hypothetical protein
VPSNEPVEFLRIIRLLCESGADFVIVGGLALQIHGGDYVTYDADFALTRVRENAKAIARALAPFHPKPVEWPEGLPFIWDEETIMRSSVLTLVTDLGRIDFLAEPAGAPPYRELKLHAITFDMEGHTVYVASIEDLISMKRAAGRPKDLAHIAELETIQKLISSEG